MIRDLTVGAPRPLLWRFCLPLLGSMLFQQLYNLTDSFVAGRFLGDGALAAVGNAYEITMVFTAIAFGCNIGCSIVTSQLFGQRRLRDVKTAVSTACVAGGVLCLMQVALGVLLARPALGWISTPADILADSAAYLEIYIYGVPFVFFYNIATGIFAALGDSRTPFFFLVASSLSNIAADILFVTAFGLGVRGVAWATFLCQGISCLLALFFLFRRLRGIGDEGGSAGRAPLFSWHLLGRIGFVALPSVCQQSFVSLGNIAVQNVINRFGSAVTASYAATAKLNSMATSCFAAVGNGISNFTGQNLGAGKTERARAGFRAGFALILCIALSLSLLFSLCGRPIVSLFLQDGNPVVLDHAMLFLRIISPFYAVIGTKLAVDGVLRGATRMGQFMTATFTDLLLRVILAYALSPALGVKGIWLAWPIGWGIAAVLSLAFYFFGGWNRGLAPERGGRPAKSPEKPSDSNTPSKE